MLISVDSLPTNFYKQPEMVAYHQAAYMVQYLLAKYDVEKFINLWTEEFASFEKIYNMKFHQVILDNSNKARQNYPCAPPINWHTFQAGCI